MNVTKRNTAEIIEIVKSYLASGQPRNYKLQVLDNGTRQDDDWWYVTVVPDRPGIAAGNQYGSRAQARGTPGTTCFCGCR